jgi:hypothetical protein
MCVRSSEKAPKKVPTTFVDRPGKACFSALAGPKLAPAGLKQWVPPPRREIKPSPGLTWLPKRGFALNSLFWGGLGRQPHRQLGRGKLPKAA